MPQIEREPQFLQHAENIAVLDPAGQGRQRLRRQVDDDMRIRAAFGGCNDGIEAVKRAGIY